MSIGPGMKRTTLQNTEGRSLSPFLAGFSPSLRERSWLKLIFRHRAVISADRPRHCFFSHQRLANEIAYSLLVSGTEMAKSYGGSAGMWIAFGHHLDDSCICDQTRRRRW